MAFKLPSKKVNPLKSKGLLNKSPFKANGNTMAYNNGEPTDKTKLKKTMNTVARPSYDADSVKANKEVRTKEFNATPEGRAMADKMQILSGAMGTQKGQSSGPNKGKFFYEDISKDPGYQTVYFDKNDYKKLADDYAEARYQFSVPRNEQMKVDHGNVASYTDTETGDVQDYGEFYGNAGGDRFKNIGKKVVEVDRPNPSNNIVNKE
tara:strand:+ start:5731 stop:6351 length:621 start_codon:yes stop_codon:yes gene_type:complete